MHLLLLCSSPYRSFKHNVLCWRWNHELCTNTVKQSRSTVGSWQTQTVLCLISSRAESGSLKPNEAFPFIRTDHGTWDCSPTSMWENFSSIYLCFYTLHGLCVHSLFLKCIVAKGCWDYSHSKNNTLKRSGYSREWFWFLLNSPCRLLFVFYLFWVVWGGDGSVNVAKLKPQCIDARKTTVKIKSKEFDACVFYLYILWFLTVSIIFIFSQICQ